MGATEDLIHLLLLSADACFLASLVLMALLSVFAAPSFDRTGKVAMQWNMRGMVTWYLPSQYGLSFAPAIAAICGIFLSALARRTAPSLTDDFVILALLRVGLAILFLCAHGIHLYFALKVAKTKIKGQKPIPKTKKHI